MIEIRTVKHADEIDQLTKLPISTYGKPVSPAYWEWAYIKSPLAHLMPDVTVAVDKGKIVGVRPFWVGELWMGERKVITAQHCDTLVQPDYRKQGIFNRMGKFAVNYLREHNCALSFGFPGPMSRRGFLSQGYRVLTHVEMAFRLLKPGRIISSYVPPKMLSSHLGNLTDRLFTPAGISLDAEAGPYQVVLSDCYTAELAVLDSLREPDTIGWVRNATNLRWRFDMHPHFKYRYVVLKKHGELCAYAVTSVQKESTGLTSGLIIDYQVKEGDVACFRVLIAQAMAQFRQTECYAMAIWAFSDPHFNNELIYNLGFKSSKKFPYRRVMDTGYMDLLLHDEQATTGFNIYDKTAWRITYAFPNFA